MRERGDGLRVLHDANCAFCRAAATWLGRHDQGGRLLLEPIADVVQTGELRLYRRALEAEMHVIILGGGRRRGRRPRAGTPEDVS